MKRSPLTCLLLAFMMVLSPKLVTAQNIEIAGMTNEQITADVNRRIVEMESILSDTIRLRDETQRDDGDLNKVRCINGKLAAIQGFIRLSTDSASGLQTALRTNDDEGAAHQYGMVVIASSRVQTLATEASQCAGDILTFSGDSELQAEVDERIPDDEDLTASPEADEQLEYLAPSHPLPEATPYQ